MASVVMWFWLKIDIISIRIRCGWVLGSSVHSKVFISASGFRPSDINVCHTFVKYFMKHSTRLLALCMTWVRVSLLLNTLIFPCPELSISSNYLILEFFFFTDPYHINRMWHKVCFSSRVQQVWIQSFPSLRAVTIPSLKGPVCPTMLPIAGGRIIGFIPFPSILVLCEMQTASSRIWTQVAISITYYNIYYTMNTLNCILRAEWLYVCFQCLCINSILFHVCVPWLICSEVLSYQCNLLQCGSLCFLLDTLLPSGVWHLVLWACRHNLFTCWGIQNFFLPSPLCLLYRLRTSWKDFFLC